MVSQAHLIVSTEPLIDGGIPRLRELLDIAERLADFLLTAKLDTPPRNKRRKRAA